MRQRGLWRATVVCALACVLQVRAASAQVHTAHDHIPDFAAAYTIVSATNGSWSNPSTWSPARVPGPSDVVRIRHAVTFDSAAGDADVVGIDAGGALRFLTNQSTSLRVGTLMVLPSGLLEVGTPANPVSSAVTAEIVIKNKPLNLSADPDQYGTGFLTVNGTTTMHGAVKEPTWARLAVQPNAGATTLVFEQALTGWKAGDVLVVPDSRDDPSRNNDAQLERRTIASISGDQRTVTLSSALSYTHPGARDQNGALVFLPHVMNVTRNVVVRSEAPTGTRGHTLHTDRSNLDMRYVELRDLGRTTIAPLSDSSNHIGRYALHLHHLIGPTTTPANGYQFTVIGNALLDTNAARSQIKWPLAIHNSHYGLVQGNAIYNAGGSGLVTEDGNESFNVIDRNFVARVQGNGDREGNKDAGVQEPGSQGAAFWFHGPNNYVRNNVGVNAVENTDEAGYGFEIFQQRVGDIRIPSYKGASTDVAGQYTTRSIYNMPLLEFSGNEAYGNPQGLTYWWVGTEWKTSRATDSSVFRDLRLWHISRYPIYGYQGSKIVFDGLKVYGDQSKLDECCRAIWFSDYRNYNTIFQNSTIVGIGALILPYASQGTTLVQDSFVATRSGIVNVTSGAPGDGPGDTFPNRAQVIKNVRFGALPGRPLRTITMEFDSHDGHADLGNKDEMFVYAYQGQPGNDFRVYYNEQASQNIAGGLAPCRDTTTRSEIGGITCAMTGAPPSVPTPPPPGGGPIACTVSSWSNWQSMSSWSACTNGSQLRTEQRMRGVITPPSNGGATCPSLFETRTASRSCVAGVPTPPEVCGNGVDDDNDGDVDELCATGGARAPAAPRKLSRLVRQNTISLNWRAPLSGGTPTSYILEAGFASGQTAVAVPVGMATALDVPNVGPGRYFLRVRAANASGASDPSNEVVVSVGCNGLPSSPRALTAQSRGSLASFEWVDDDGCNDSAYHVSAGSAPGLSNLAQAMVGLTDLAGAGPAGTYYVRVSTVSPFGETLPSNEVALNIQNNSCTPPTFPTGLDIVRSGAQLLLAWAPADMPAALAADDISPISWLIEAGTGPGLANLGTFSTGRQTSLVAVAPSGTYYLRVRPMDVCGAGQTSNEFVIQIP